VNVPDAACPSGCELAAMSTAEPVTTPRTQSSRSWSTCELDAGESIMSITESIVGFQDRLDEWRQLGSRHLQSGVELIGGCDEDGDPWLHAVYPALSKVEVGQLEIDLGRRLPATYRSFLLGCGGLSCFAGLFMVHPYRKLEKSLAVGAVTDSVLRLNQLLSGAEWMTSSAIAFASNALDGSVQVLGMGRTPAEVLRCDVRTGEVVERHEHIFACVDDRLSKCDRNYLSDHAAPTSGEPTGTGDA